MGNFKSIMYSSLDRNSHNGPKSQLRQLLGAAWYPMPPYQALLWLFMAWLGLQKAVCKTQPVYLCCYCVWIVLSVTIMKMDFICCAIWDGFHESSHINTKLIYFYLIFYLQLQLVLLQSTCNLWYLLLWLWERIDKLWSNFMQWCLWLWLLWLFWHHHS